MMGYDFLTITLYIFTSSILSDSQIICIQALQLLASSQSLRSLSEAEAIKLLGLLSLLLCEKTTKTVRYSLCFLISHSQAVSDIRSLISVLFSLIPHRGVLPTHLIHQYLTIRP